MDQSKMEQRLKRLMAMRDEMEAMMDANLVIMKEPVKASLVWMDTWIEKIKAEMKANHQKMDSCLGEAKSSPETTEACEGETEACLEKSQEVPVRVMDEETTGAAKDRSRDLNLAVGRCEHLKMWTKRDGRVRQRVCRHRRTAEPSYRPCSAQGRTS
jgi:hypothetical protein